MASRKQAQRKLQRQARKKQEKLARLKQAAILENDAEQTALPSEEVDLLDLSGQESEEQQQQPKESMDVGDNISFLPANDMRKNSYVLLRDQKFPCKILELHKAKTGKHGGAKIRVVGLDMFTGKKYDDIFLSKAQVEIPVVKKLKYNLTRLDENANLCYLRPVGGNVRDLEAAGLSAPGSDKGEEKKMELDPEDNEIHARLMDLWRKQYDPSGRSSPLLVTIVEAMGNEAIADVRAP